MHGTHHVVRKTALGIATSSGQNGMAKIATPTRSWTSDAKAPLDPDVADEAPADTVLTPYDHENAITYLRLLDADAEGAEGADWKEVAQIVLHIDPKRQPARARRARESHLSRARWMTEQGYRLLLKTGWPEMN
jgi:Uncharacterized conserved protein (DUF2285)